MKSIEIECSSSLYGLTNPNKFRWEYSGFLRGKMVFYAFTSNDEIIWRYVSFINYRLTNEIHRNS